MRSRILTIFALLLLGVSSAWANSGMPGALQEVRNYFMELDGVVVEAGESKVLVDIGLNKKASPGLLLNVFHKGESIVHPVTGKVLGQREVPAGSVSLTYVFPEYSESLYSGSAPLQPGDRVALALPVSVRLAKDNLSADDDIIIAHFFSANPVMTESEDPDAYTLSLRRLTGAVSYEVKQSDGTVIIANTVAEAAPDFRGLRMGAAEKISMPKGRYLSIARGQVYRNNENAFVVASTDTAVNIFDPNDNMSLVEELKGKFSVVLNVEVADLDHDGVDEIFVSHVFKAKSVQSKIYRHDGRHFVLAADELPWLFRSVRNTDGSRMILAQKISKDGEYSGEIHHFIYEDGRYMEGEAIKGTLGKRLPGFSMMNLPDTNEDLFINIGAGSRLTLSTFRKVEYTAPDYFGDTFHTFTIGQRIKTSSSNPEGGDLSTYYEKLNYVHPRIEVVDNRYYIAVQNNLLARVFVGSPIFTRSGIGMYSFHKGLVRKAASAEDLEPVIVDIWYYEDGGDKWVMALTSSNTWVFQKGESHIIAYKITGTDPDFQ